ncbi:MAG TPA: mechanosensitive ion channel protein MscS, partial [Hyphomonas sp.]|nr:mechanosensitive ion channel protein MscS [Hyphomonas sp.]
GLGFAFGMQKVVSNFVSGIVLLSERSIKPQDVIEVGETFGVVESLGLRYTSITTQEGKEFLIPNEKLMTDTVINWSFSNKRVR